MTHKKMQQLMLTTYLVAIEVVKSCRSPKQIKQILTHDCLDHGVCWAISQLTDDGVWRHKSWIREYCTQGYWWGDYPKQVDFMKAETLKTLELRADILSKILKEGKYAL